MICNIARSLAGGSEQSENWELIEEVSGIAGFSKTYGGSYSRGFSSEPDGTPYNFTAVAVYVYANEESTSQHRINKPTVSSAMTSVEFGDQCDPRQEGEGYVSVIRIKDGALYDKNNCMTDVPSITDDPMSLLPADDPITGVSLGYYTDSDTNVEPYHVKWRIYAVRA